jgi:hypothetical protein
VQSPATRPRRKTVQAAPSSTLTTSTPRISNLPSAVNPASHQGADVEDPPLLVHSLGQGIDPQVPRAGRPWAGSQRTVVSSGRLRGRVRIPTGGDSPRAEPGTVLAEQDPVRFRGRQSEDGDLGRPIFESGWERTIWT